MTDIVDLPPPPINEIFLENDGYVSRVWADWFQKLKDTSDDRFTVVDATTTIDASTSQIILADASSAAFTITMPAIKLADKSRYIVKKIDSSANAVTVAPNGSETIDGELTMDIIFQYDAMQIVPHETNWSIV